MILYRFCALVLVFNGALGAVKVLDADTEVISAQQHQKRQEKQLILTQTADLFQPPVILYGEDGKLQCVTADGARGVCRAFRECYPMFYLAAEGAGVYSEALKFDIFNSTKKCFSDQFVHDGSGPAMRRYDDNQDDSIVCCSTGAPRSQISQAFGGGYGLPQKEKVVQPSCASGNVIDPKGTGAVAPMNGYPWMAALVNGNKMQFCGGSLIDNYHVLTAAHCFENYNSQRLEQLTIYLGAHNLAEKGEKQRVGVKASKLFRHRGWDNVKFTNDVAILRLRKPVDFNLAVSPICIRKDRVDLSLSSKDGNNATLAGWGKTKPCARCPTSPVLLHTSMKVWNNMECQQNYSKAPVPNVPRIQTTMMCAGSVNHDACQGDSGGPLVLRSESVYRQIGIVSWGIGCGAYPGVYTRVSDYYDWIQRNVKRF